MSSAREIAVKDSGPLRTSIDVDPCSILVSQASKPLHVLDTSGSEPSGIDLSGADGYDASDVLALQLSLYCIQVQAPRLSVTER
jgi:hypothetical protein